MSQRQTLYTIAFFVLAEFFFMFIFSGGAEIIIAPGHLSADTENTILCVCQILAEVAAIIYALNSLKMLRVRDITAPIHLSGFMMVCLVLFTATGIFGADIFTETLNLPDWSPDSESKQVPFVMAYICIIAPVLEEIINRAIIQGYMLRHGIHPVSAIIISAIIFGVSHLNPAQIPFATICGIIFGIIYWKTGSLVLPIFIHIANNTTSILFENMGEVKYIDLLGGTISTTIITILCVGTCVTFYWFFIKRTPTYFHFEQ